MLQFVVFGCGAAVMVLEIVGARILAPFLGTSIVVWTGLIGVVMASLALGYWQGGRIADRHPSFRALSVVIVLAALCTAATALTKALLLDFLTGHGLGPRLGVIAATLLLFAPAAGLLGMVAPFAVRLTLRDPATAGATAGRLYALSTLGSIVGTFAAGFILVAALGSTTILLVTAGFLLVVSLAASRADARGKAVVAAAIALCGLWLTAQEAMLAEAGIHDVDTAYGRVLVYQGLDPASDRPIRVMTTGPTRFQSAMYPDAPEELALDYTRFFTIGLDMAPAAPRVLVIGGGAYSFPRHVLAKRPEADVTVVELDPGVTRLAREHFGLADHPGLTIVHEDARMVVNRDAAPYDLIYLDAFGTDYAPPFHLVTRESAARLQRLLVQHGTVIVNAIGPLSGNGARFIGSLAATFAAVFDDVALYPLGNPETPEVAQNIILVARNRPAAMPAPEDPELRRWLTRRLDGGTFRDEMVLTDDHAPVEWLCALLPGDG
ncbi:fused MFS/spermidine synthase [Solidesulfovibrio sp.]